MRRKKTPKAADYARRVRMLHENGIQVNGSFVLGFDHDRKDVFTRTADWIEENRLECATFHILTPYPATPLFRQMEAEGRLLHRDWALYDTAHAVFRPKQHVAGGTGTRLCLDVSAPLLTRFDLAAPARGLARRCSVSGDVVPVQALQPVLAIAHQAPSGACRWRPLVELTRLRHVRFREELAASETLHQAGANVVAAGV